MIMMMIKTITLIIPGNVYLVYLHSSKPSSEVHQENSVIQSQNR